MTRSRPGTPAPHHRAPHPGRRRTWHAASHDAHGEATSTALAAELPFTRQAVAKHLTILARAGLVEARRQGREVRYTVRAERLDEAAQAMSAAAARWDKRLRAIKRLAEAEHRDPAR
jgi:ArsR family transcriptional regulator, cadmium/lead-responsive transcriptional repressor